MASRLISRSLSLRHSVLSTSRPTLINLSTKLSTKLIPQATVLNQLRYSSSSSQKPEEKKPVEDSAETSSSRGVLDPGTSRHGYDPLKPRKPLSRIAIGKAFDANKAEQQATVGFLNWKAALLFISTGGLLIWYFRRERDRVEVERLEETNRGYGKPLIGGPFSLTDQDGNKFTEKDLFGKYALIYFGFSRCPDICPDELDKLSQMLDVINKDEKIVTPVFITCDPYRDTPEVLKEYLAEFHPDIIGLTGSYDDIKNICKLYRVYFSLPPNLKPNQEYLVDHSIFFYFMDPEGQYLDVFGRQYNAETAVEKMREHMAVWKPAAEREAKKESFWGKFFS